MNLIFLTRLFFFQVSVIIMSCLGKRGPLKKAGVNLSKTFYKCLVPECDRQMRGDHLRSHYLSKVNFQKLQNVKNIENDLALESINAIADEVEKKHTQFFFATKKFTENDIPSFKEHKSCADVSDLQNPFQRCDAARAKKQKTNETHPEDEDEQSSELNEIGNICESAEQREVGEQSPHGGHENNALEEDVLTLSEQNAEKEQCSLGEGNSQRDETVTDKGSLTEEQHFVDEHFVIDLESTQNQGNAEQNTSIPISPQVQIGLEDSTIPGIPEVFTDISENNFKDQVMSAISEVFVGNALKEEMDSFTDSLSAKIAEKIKELSESKPKARDAKSDWIEAENNYICKPCLKFSSSESVPAKLKALRRGNFGFVDKNQEQFRVNFNMKTHESNELHKWCCLKQEELEAELLQNDLESKKAGKLIVNNALLCFKKGWSSEDFLSLNDKDNLLSEDIKPATKNDSSAQFFDIRNTCFYKVTDKVKYLFKEIDSFSFTLDKVTVNRNSYTVLLAFFFWEGALHVVLLKLVKMTTDYDAVGTARMVLDTLCETTGLSKPEIGAKARHMSCDGVYGEDDERKRGGGCLSLRTNLTALLGLDPDDLTGTWDPAHLYQLFWFEVLKEFPEIMEALKTLFDAMKNFNVGKAGSVFEERATELGYYVLKNKSYQATRFVSSLVRGIKSGLRNLPTICAILGQDLQDALADKDNTKAKDVLNTLTPLTNCSKLAFIVGLSQILEVYTRCSLSVQHSLWFPTMTWDKIKIAKSEISALANKWQWEEKNLEISGIGSPKVHIENLKLGKFCPYVPKGSVKKNVKTLEKFAENQELGKLSVDKIFDDSDNCTLEVAGEISVEGDIQEERVVGKLQKICQRLTEIWNERQNECNLDKVRHDVFSKPLVYNGSAEDEFNFFKSKLEIILEALPEYQAEHFDAMIATPGFLKWNNYFLERKTVSINIVWKQWVHSLKSDLSESCEMFIRLFQNLQVRVMSEAMADSR